jgi:hypothetical protein
MVDESNVIGRNEIDNLVDEYHPEHGIIISSNAP